MGRLHKSVYESLPVLYLLAGLALVWLSWRHRAAPWSTACGVGGLLAVVVALALWLRRGDYRATSESYQRRGQPLGGNEGDTR